MSGYATRWRLIASGATFNHIIEADTRLGVIDLFAEWLRRNEGLRYTELEIKTYEVHG